MHARLSRTDRFPKECVVGQCHAPASGKGKAEPQRHLEDSKYTSRECMNLLEKSANGSLIIPRSTNWNSDGSH